MRAMEGWLVARRAAGCHFGHHFSVALPLLMKIVSTLNRERTSQKPRENGSKPHSEPASCAHSLDKLPAGKKSHLVVTQGASKKSKGCSLADDGTRNKRAALLSSLRLPSPWAHSLARAVPCRARHSSGKNLIPSRKQRFGGRN